MYKQIFSMAFLVLASCIWLAHEIIPHHEHEGNVCFEHTCSTPGHSDTTEDHDNPANSDNECCLLFNLLNYTPVNHSNEISCPCWANGNHHGKYQWSLPPGFRSCICHVLPSLPIKQYYYEFIPYHNYTHLIFGLRAPPVC